MKQTLLSKAVGIWLRNILGTIIILLGIEYLTPIQVNPVLNISILLSIGLISIPIYIYRAIIQKVKVLGLMREIILTSSIISFITTIFLYFGWIPPIGALAIILGLGGLSIIKLNNLEKLYQKVFRPLYSYAIIGFLILLIIRGLAYTTWIQSIPIAVNIVDILGKIEIILVAHIIALAWVLTALDKKFGLIQPEITTQDIPRENIRGLKWLPKGEWKYILAILGVMLLAFVLRIWNLGGLDPHYDEYLHLKEAQNLLLGGELQYQRALLVTQSVRFFYWISGASSFYEYVYWGRVPSFIFSTLTIIPLYLWGRKINRTVGLIAGLLWATSPWMIGTAKIVREYAYYPFIVLIVSYLLITLLDNLINYKKNRIYYNIISAIIILLVTYYAYKIDVFSTLKMLIFILVVIFIYILTIHYKNVISFIKTLKISKYIILALIFSIISFTLYVFLESSQINKQISIFNDRFFNFYLNPHSSDIWSNPMQWWENRFTIGGVFIILASSLYFIKSKYLGASWAFFLASFIFYSFFFNRGLGPRYTIYTMPFFIIIISVGVYAMFVINSSKFKNIILILFLVPAFYLPNILYTSISSNFYPDNATGLHREEISGIIDFLIQDINTEEDIIISSFINQADSLIWGVGNEPKIYEYNYKDEKRFELLDEIISKNNKGWIILDYRRGKLWALGIDYFLQIYPQYKEQLILYQDTPTIQIYSWSR
jgi:hypothetical protein